MNGAEFLLRALQHEGVETIFGYPGGAILPVYDALYTSSLRHILVRHEQAAAMAADGYARATGKVGVCMVTSGPGATNLLTGIANAFMDSVPLVAITGQVATPLLGTDAFQEVDIFGMSLPVVKHSFLVRSANELPQVVREAFRIAASGRPGPVLIDLPKDVALAPADFSPLDRAQINSSPAPSPAALAHAKSLLRASRKPVIYAGGGIRLAGAVEAFRAFAELTAIPVVATLKGLGALPADHELFLGMMGMHGTKCANDAVQNCDLLLCIGARFDDRATGPIKTFAPDAKIIHLDVDPAEMGKRRTPDAPVIGDLRAALWGLALPLKIDAWRRSCLAEKKTGAVRYDAPGESVDAPRFLNRLAAAATGETFVACDVGQHQMRVAQHYPFARPEHQLTSGGLGAMGYGLPAAIGAQVGRPDARVILVTGDGSILMNIHELATIARYKLPVKIVLLDNQFLGMVRQWQELFYQEKYSETDLYDNPDFVKLAEAFGIPAFAIETAAQEDEAIGRLLQEPGPVFLQVRLDPEAKVWPIVPPGKSNSQMLEDPAFTGAPS